MRVLVAGIGNIFLGDDGFGVEVVRRIDPAQLPEEVEIADYGIKGLHLAYDLLDARHDTLIMVDAVPLDDRPGTLAVLDASEHATARDAGPVDAHSMSPDVVLQALQGLGGSVERVLVVGCRPAALEEHMGLSEPVSAALDEAVRLVVELAHDEVARPLQAVGAAAAPNANQPHERHPDRLQGRPPP